MADTVTPEEFKNRSSRWRCCSHVEALDGFAHGEMASLYFSRRVSVSVLAPICC